MCDAKTGTFRPAKFITLNSLSMGIETILAVLGLIIVIGIGVAVSKSKSKSGVGDPDAKAGRK